MRKSTSASTNIRSVAYYADKNLLEISFHSGGTYHYAGVPADVYQQFSASPAKDDFLIRNIKLKYRCSKLLIV